MKHFFLNITNTITPTKQSKIAELRSKVGDCVTIEDFNDIFEEEITFTRLSIFRSQTFIRTMPLLCVFSCVFALAILILPNNSDIYTIFFMLTASSLGLIIMLAPYQRLEEQKYYLKHLYELKKKDVPSLKVEFTSEHTDFKPLTEFEGEKKELCVLFKRGGFNIKNERAFFSAISKIISDKEGAQYKELHKTFNKLDGDGYTDQLKSLEQKFNNNN